MHACVRVLHACTLLKLTPTLLCAWRIHAHTSASRQGHRTQQPLLPEPLRPDEGYYKNSTHPVCQFLRAGEHS